MIIPVYNADKELDRCLSSLLNQSYPNVEIIAIDDASEDFSRGILQKYDRKFRRMHCLTNARNMGPGRARNAGLSIAAGEYVVFVDSDDYVNEAYIAELVSSGDRYKADIVFSNIDPERQIIKKMMEKYYPSSKSLYTLPLEGLTAVWGKMYRSSFLDAHRIHFVDCGKGIGEDIAFSFISNYCANVVSFAPNATYHYCMHDAGMDSETGELVLSLFKALWYLRKEYEERDRERERERQLIAILIRHIAYNYQKIVRTGGVGQHLLDTFIQESKQIADYDRELIINNEYLTRNEVECYIAIMGS